MSASTPIKKQYQPKVHYSQYIRTANTGDENNTKPADPAAPAPPEAE